MHRPACHCHGHGIVHRLQVPAGNLAEQIGPLDGIARVQQTLLQVLQSVPERGKRDEKDNLNYLYIHF